MLPICINPFLVVIIYSIFRYVRPYVCWKQCRGRAILSAVIHNRRTFLGIFHYMTNLWLIYSILWIIKKCIPLGLLVEKPTLTTPMPLNLDFCLNKWGCIFFLFLTSARSPLPVGLYPNHFLNPRGKSNLNLT